jgi:isopentenyl-diphosphate delta-isomerase
MSSNAINVPPSIESRKLDHIAINLERNVEVSGLTTGFERLQFFNNALPEIDLAMIKTDHPFLGLPLRAPFLISSMTGGVERGWEINRRLAEAAQAHGCAIAVGSQRAALEDPERAQFFAIRDLAPTVPIFANLGAVQLNYGFTADHCRRAVDMVQGDGLFLHLNPLQEALQSGGNTAFSMLAHKIERVCRWLEVPVIVKEVGFGITVDVARRLADCGVSAIDVSGAGGTSWSAVEHLRCADELSREVSRAFLGWGVPTARCLVDIHQALPDLPMIASGGMRSGLDAAKALAIGAHLVGIAGPLLRAAAESEERAHAVLGAVIDELRVTMFAVGASEPSELTSTLLFDLDAPLLSRTGEATP